MCNTNYDCKRLNLCKSHILLISKNNIERGIKGTVKLKSILSMYFAIPKKEQVF